MSTKPKILISISQNTDGKAYASAIQEAGGNPVLSFAYSGSERFDALVLAGGGDIDPHYYGEANNGSHPPDERRDHTEMALCQIYTQEKKPILAICRGCQLLNV
ncbi:MAG: gamma-glutamyl-gamma-aminobutyrate hydrolase family protein, partial [Clostridia bacterium]|nr:gamma-glutamyl-gamma-aminobutyrate hydrolase family protein [Clostridia bacterium]